MRQNDEILQFFELCDNERGSLTTYVPIAEKLIYNMLNRYKQIISIPIMWKPNEKKKNQ